MKNMVLSGISAALLLACGESTVLGSDTGYYVAATSGPLTYEVDAGRARHVGWGDDEATLSELVAAGEQAIRRSVEALEPSLGLEVASAPDADRLVVSSTRELDAETWSRLDRALSSLGLLELRIVAEAGDLDGSEGDLSAERAKLEAWASAHPDRPLSDFSRLSPEDGGPHPAIEWRARIEPLEASDTSELERTVALIRPSTLAESFGAAHLSRVYPTEDQLGYPAMGFELLRSSADDFGAFTESNLGRLLAIVSNGRILSAPSLAARLTQGGIVQGRFTDAEIRGLLTALRRHDAPLRRVE